MAKILYISYDGMTDSLGQSQVLSYLKLLCNFGHSFHVISYDKPDRFEKFKQETIDFIGQADITWLPLVYHKSPPILSTLKDIRNGKKAIKQLMKEHDFEIVHCRSYISAILGVWMKEKYGTKFLFDMRGWWPDEKKESGHWANPIYTPVYNYFKNLERKFFRTSDQCISLTEIGKIEIVKQKLQIAEKVNVIPTCVNFDLFKPFDPNIRSEFRKKLNIDESATVMLYSGSLGGNYRTDLTLTFFRYLYKKRKDSIFLFLTGSPKELVDMEIENSGIPEDRFRVASCSFIDVHKYLMVGDIGVVMYNTQFSVKGRSPTKLGEYWGCGLPVLSAKGIGDLESIIAKYPNGGLLVESLEEESEYEKVIDTLIKTVFDKNELREYAFDYYDIKNGVQKYNNTYKKMLNG